MCEKEIANSLWGHSVVVIASGKRTRSLSKKWTAQQLLSSDTVTSTTSTSLWLLLLLFNKQEQ